MDENIPEDQSVPDDIEDWQEPEPNRGTLRTCVNCGREYYELDHIDSTYWEHPWAYFDGCETHCLSCWLGCGPE